MRNTSAHKYYRSEHANSCVIRTCKVSLSIVVYCQIHPFSQSAANRCTFVFGVIGSSMPLSLPLFLIVGYVPTARSCQALSGDSLSGLALKTKQGLHMTVQAVQAAQVTFEDYFMSDLNIAPLKIVGYEGVFGFFFMMAFMLPIVQRLPGNDGDGLHEDSFDTWHVSLPQIPPPSRPPSKRSHLFLCSFLELLSSRCDTTGINADFCCLCMRSTCYEPLMQRQALNSKPAWMGQEVTLLLLLHTVNIIIMPGMKLSGGFPASLMSFLMRRCSLVNDSRLRSACCPVLQHPSSTWIIIYAEWLHLVGAVSIQPASYLKTETVRKRHRHGHSKQGSKKRS